MATASVTKVIEIDVRQSATAQQHLKQVADGMRNLDSTVDKAGKNIKGSLDFITGGLRAMAQGFVIGAITTGVLSVVAGFRDMSDSAQVLRARLAQVTGGTEEASKAFTRIVQISRTQGQSMEAVGTLYEKIARNSKNLGVTQEGVAAITNSFAASLRLSGAGAQQAEAAILQFSQALASGRLAGDEYRSMTENNAVFMQALGEATGKSMGELKKMSTEGKIDLAFLQEAFFKVGKDGKTMLDRLDEGAAKLPMTFKQARENVTTELTNLVDALTNTANTSESIFTRMANAVARGLNAAATEVRIYQAGAAADAATRAGKAVVPEGPEKTIQEQAIDKQIDNIKKYRAQVSELEKDLSKVDPNKPFAKFTRSKFEMDIKAITARADAMSDAIVKAQQAADALINKPGRDALISGKPTQPAAKEKKGGSKAQDALDVFEQRLMRKDINDDENSGAGKNEIALYKAYDATLKKGKELEEQMKRLLPQARDLDYEARTKVWDKDMDEQRDKVMKERRAAQDAYLEAGMKKFDKIEDKTRSSAEILYDTRKELIELIDMAEKLGKVDMAEGFTRQLSLLEYGFEKTKKAGKSMADEITEAMQNSTKEMADAILDFVTGTEGSFSKMLLNILKQIASAQLQKALNPVMKEGGNWLSQAAGLVGRYFTGGSTGASSGITPGWQPDPNMYPMAKGGAWDRGVQFFADGGVVNSATGFSHAGGRGVMGESGPEAIMPLQRGADGKLGVGTAPVSVSIINMSGGEVSQSEGTDENGNKKIEIMIHKAVNDGVQSGKYDKSMANTYGLRRKAKG